MYSKQAMYYCMATVLLSACGIQMSTKQRSFSIKLGLHRHTDMRSIGSSYITWYNVRQATFTSCVGGAWVYFRIIALLLQV